MHLAYIRVKSLSVNLEGLNILFINTISFDVLYRIDNLLGIPVIPQQPQYMDTHVREGAKTGICNTNLWTWSLYWSSTTGEMLK